MNQTKQVPMMISLPSEVRDKLRIFAAESNMRNPNRVATAAGIARELVLEGIEKIEVMEANLQPPEALPENDDLLVEPIISSRNSKTIRRRKNAKLV